MWDFLSTTPAQVVLAVAILAMLSIAGWYVVARFRERTEDNGPSASELLSNFREMHRQGDIDAAEYRTIKTTLGAKLQQDAESNDKQTDNGGAN